MTRDNIFKNTAEELSTQELIDRKKKNLEAIFDAVPECLLLVDANLNVIRVNDATRKLTNKDYNEIINHSLGEALDCTTVSIEKKACGTGKFCETCILRQNIQKVLKTMK